MSGEDRPAAAAPRPDLYRRLADLTPARLRLEARPGATRLSDLLAFQQDHAAARDAIHGQVDWDALADALAPLPVLRVASRATDRATYLRRPDLGRQLAEADHARLDAARLPDDPPLLVVIGDGLSAPAVMAQVAPLMAALVARLPELQDRPVVLAQGARVALGDAIGAAMGAALVLILIGERPGLSVVDSLGAYLTQAPRVGLRDSARNCVSNIHARGGLSHAAAADRLTWLIHEARRIGTTGVALKDDSGLVQLDH
ncbi:ethanolamine ammonia-lyase subunit EutC [Paracoccus gahaiensis]|uniref:Ethanolamine ammonia-lyase small subunit n=1 Tax=Paracoccus gahaiensis TaxID=1706839 RepID=A0A4U0R1M9_9RHOB|nr:ethanolamine ammonia-lyase subunit EutC [Paracoccus gahaiensis]TJZ88589.1 ethanolamine ammonia-lyase subunit EutC [Paracoccus gahaiensis]